MYARTIADNMGLRDWIVQVAHDGPVTPGVRATAQIAEGRKLIQVAFVDDLETLSAEEQRHVFVHELAHALVEDLWQSVRVGVREEIGGAAYRVFIAQVQREAERLVDQIATAVETGMVLP
jgi:hypothetical protein